MPNEHAIKFLSELKDDACVVIFTRDDAETQLPEDREFITDEEWQATIRDFDNGFLNDDHWLEFGDIVNTNLDGNPESE